MAGILAQVFHCLKHCIDITAKHFAWAVMGTSANPLTT